MERRRKWLASRQLPLIFVKRSRINRILKERERERLEDLLIVNRREEVEMLIS